MSGPTDRAPPADAGVRNYTFLCLVALLGVLLVLLVTLPRAGPFWILLPVLLGLGGVLLRWRVAPLVFLVALGGVLYVAAVMRAPFHTGRPAPAPATATDLLLAAACLAYVAGHYRLQSLVTTVFPHDPRRSPAVRPRPGVPAWFRRPPAQVPQQRSPRLSSPGELSWLLLALPTWALLALVAWRLLVPAEVPDVFGNDLPFADYEWYEYPGVESVQLLTDLLWRGRLLLWVLGAGVLVVSGLLGTLAWGRATPAEAEVFLHDTVWRESRREQRLLCSWQVWARWRRGRGKENP